MFIISMKSSGTRREDPMRTTSICAVIITAYTATYTFRSPECIVTKEDNLVFLSRHGRVLVNKLTEKEVK